MNEDLDNFQSEEGEDYEDDNDDVDVVYKHLDAIFQEQHAQTLVQEQSVDNEDPDSEADAERQERLKLSYPVNYPCPPPKSSSNNRYC